MSTELTLPQRAAVALGTAGHEVKLIALAKESTDITAVIDPAGRDQAHRIGMTQEYLKYHLRYDPCTGLFVRLIANSQNTKVGDVAGWKSKLGYIELKIDGVFYKAHRLAILYMTGKMPDGDVDHANLDRSDNRYINLREATRSQNQFNKTIGSKNKSGFKGVNFHKASGRFIAQCSINGKKHYLGVFDAPEDASAAYRHFASKAHGQYFRGE